MLRARATAQQAVAVAVAQRGRVDVVALGGADPALLAEHDGHRLARHQFGLVDSACAASRATSGERRASPNFLASASSSSLTSFFSLALLARIDWIALALGVQLVLLAADLHFLQARQLAQPGLEDVVGLLLAELEARHQHRLGLVLGADDADHLVEVEEGDQQAFQQVQAALDLVQAVVAGGG